MDALSDNSSALAAKLLRSAPGSVSLPDRLPNWSRVDAREAIRRNPLAESPSPTARLTLSRRAVVTDAGSVTGLATASVSVTVALEPITS